MVDLEMDLETASLPVPGRSGVKLKNLEELDRFDDSFCLSCSRGLRRSEDI